MILLVAMIFYPIVIASIFKKRISVPLFVFLIFLLSAFLRETVTEYFKEGTETTFKEGTKEFL